MVQRRSLLATLPLIGAASVPAGAQDRGVPSTGNRSAIHVAQYGAKGDGVADDTKALQVALDDALGKTLALEPRTYRLSDTLWIPGHSTGIEACGALLEFDVGDKPAIDCRTVGMGVYPQEVRIRQLNINLNCARTTAFALKLSHSSLEDISVCLRHGAASAIGFDLAGDEAHGTGSYYNVFKNCSVQGQGTGQTGIRFGHTAPLHRAPNANTWLSGRIGQCEIGIDVSGCGNSFFNPTLEGCDTAFSFDRATENSVFGCYMEACAIGFSFAAASQRNGVVGIFGTGVPTMFADRGRENWTVSGYAPALFARGLRFGDTSTNPNVLDAYQEGFWTPTLQCSDCPGEYRIQARNAEYIRIGRQVTIMAELSIETMRSGRGTVSIGGLPCPPAMAGVLVGCSTTTNVSWPADVKSIALKTLKDDSRMALVVIGARNGEAPFVLAAEQLTASATLSLLATYFTTD